MSLVFVGRSAAIRQIEEEARRAARSDAKVLITGESGVGKELVAHLVHRCSARHGRPFLAMNCAGVPDSLLESELFGHVRGSFTGAYRDKPGLLEQAHGGTIFLDEIGEMSLRMQAMLLRFLEDGDIQRVGSERRTSSDVRVVAATNRVLLDQIAANAFREDLYYRLNVIHLIIPPLRDRREDVEPLFQHFLRSFSDKYHMQEPTLLPEVAAALTAYDWPGNVREVKNVAERLVVRSNGTIGLDDLPAAIARRVETAPMSEPRDGAPAAAASRPRADELFERMVNQRESFWKVVYLPFMSRDVTREDVRSLVTTGLNHTRGNYKMLLDLFNMEPGDYKRFLNFLRKHQCHMPFQRFRSGAVLRATTEPKRSDRVGNVA